MLAGGQAVALGPRAFDLLVALVERAGRLVTKEELLDTGLARARRRGEQSAGAGLGAAQDSRAGGDRNDSGTRLPIHRRAHGQRATGHRRVAGHPPETLLAPIDDSVPSIAVLPFVNMSDDAANEYFADGIAEELLNVLSKIRGLRVASHTSAFSFKGSKVDIATVAQKLNVATILEGSVRKAGKRVRITVQLVQVATDSHLWSETYDRELEDIFAVQDDIAQSVVKELRSALLGEKRNSSASAAVKAEVRAAAKGRGENAEAYRLYLQGRVLVARRTQASVTTGIEHLPASGDTRPGVCVGVGRAGACPDDRGGIRWLDAVRRGVSDALARLQNARWRWSPISRRGIWRSRAFAGDTTGIGPGRTHRCGARWSWRREMRRSCLPRRRWPAVLAASTSRSRFAGERLRSILSTCVAHRYLGLYSLFAGLPEQAEAALKEALELNPLGGMTHCGSGRRLSRAGSLRRRRSRHSRRNRIDGFRLLGLSVALSRAGPERGVVRRARATGRTAHARVSERPGECLLRQCRPGLRMAGARVRAA